MKNNHTKKIKEEASEEQNKEIVCAWDENPKDKPIRYDEIGVDEELGELLLFYKRNLVDRIHVQEMLDTFFTIKYERIE